MIIVVIPLPRPAAKGGTRTKSENQRPRYLHLIGQPISAAGHQVLRQGSRQLQPVVRPLHEKSIQLSFLAKEMLAQEHHDR